MTESERAKEWRREMGLTMDALGELTGYSREAIVLFERGTTSTGGPHSTVAWRRYKAACLAVTILKHYRQTTVDQWEWRKG